jgi:hypothetical protein
MQIRVDHLTACCGDQPSLDTWDENESRSVRCIHCGRRTASHWGREQAFEEWEELASRLPIYVIAGSEFQARIYAREAGLGREGASWRYVGDPYALSGLQDVTVVFTGTWQRRRDAEELDALVSRIRRVRRQG